MFGKLKPGYFSSPSTKEWTRNNRSSYKRISPKIKKSLFLSTFEFAHLATQLPAGLLEHAKVISRCPNKHLRAS